MSSRHLISETSPSPFLHMQELRCPPSNGIPRSSSASPPGVLLCKRPSETGDMSPPFFGSPPQHIYLLSAPYHVVSILAFPLSPISGSSSLDVVARADIYDNPKEPSSSERKQMERSQFLPSLPSCLWGMNHVESGVRPLECAALECISACGPAMDGTRSKSSRTDRQGEGRAGGRY